MNPHALKIICLVGSTSIRFAILSDPQYDPTRPLKTLTNNSDTLAFDQRIQQGYTFKGVSPTIRIIGERRSHWSRRCLNLSGPLIL